MIQQTELILPPFPRGIHLITHLVEEALTEWPRQGLLNLFIHHTSAGLMINENADPSVRIDLNNALDKLAPERIPYYTHTMEGDDDMPAHIKAALTGVSLHVPVSSGRMKLGTWQGLFLCEFRDHGGRRKLTLTLCG